MVAHLVLLEVQHVGAAGLAHPEQMVVVVPVQEAARNIVTVLQPHKIEIERTLAREIGGFKGGKRCREGRGCACGQAGVSWMARGGRLVFFAMIKAKSVQSAYPIQT
ncbi:hypothetical protein D3C72_1555440 [compost metagenome]